MKSGTPIAVSGEEAEREGTCGSVAGRVHATEVEASIVSAVWSFFAVYTSAFIILTLLTMATGQDFLTAFAAVAACINNSGIGIAGVGSNFSPLSETAKVILAFAMLLGRLEIFTLLVLFTPAFWRR